VAIGVNMQGSKEVLGLWADAVGGNDISQLLARKKALPSPGRTGIHEKIGRALKLPSGELSKLADLQRKEALRKEWLRLEQFLRDASLSGDATEEGIAFLKARKLRGKRPSPIYYYRELQNLRDPLPFPSVAQPGESD
jgi:hypothetical protein